MIIGSAIAARAAATLVFRWLLCVMKTIILLLAVALVWGTNASFAPLQVTVKQGTLEGVQLGNSTRQFLGVPFATPPVGNLRFRAPQPAQSWQGVREAKYNCTFLPLSPSPPLPIHKAFPTDSAFC